MTITKKETQSSDLRNKNQEEADKQLTPWQKANLEYTQQRGQEAGWSPKVIEGNSETEPEKEPKTDGVKEEALPELGTRPAVEFETSFSDRLPKVKYQRQSLLYRRMITIILILLIPLIAVIYYVSPLAKLAGVTVIGNQAVSAKEIVKAADFEMDGEIWPQYFTRSAELKKIKESNPRIEQVSLKIENLNHFKIRVKEYEEIAVLAHDNTYSPILANGYTVNETMENPTEKLPILENFTDQATIMKVLSAYQSLSEELQEAISQIKYTPKDSNQELLLLYMNDGNQVIVNISNLKSQMKYYAQVAKEMSEKGVIDMEVGIFSHPYEKEEETSSTGEETTTSSSAEGELATPAGE
ncbi:cell division protein FtsQ/DivIB [Enterococcus asini]|uniref:cell division protein FtsQ/DivIB n=1 Tax=Enterococcus asini TaxID=57732 RepID=UPI00288EB481|nr:cell division protein FtsQ/DivIB [Enterococcus asini]MDT2756439.1 cell division protein FtsQ/DivIB [Enterococcus asini]